MEKYFKPVHSPPSSDEIKARRHHHHHHLHHHQDHRSQSYATFEDTDRNTDESQGHHRHHHHGHSLHYGSNRNAHHRHHRAQHFHHSEEDEILYSHDTPVTLSKASSSSLSSSSSSSSSSSWYTEASANDPFSLRHAERPQHSLSCSNIPDIRKSYREDDSSEPIVFATIKHGSNGNICNQFHGSSQQRGGHALSSLDRGHSRSEEGLVQGIEGHDEEQDKYGPLYKTTSLNRSLAFSEEDILLGVSRGPKRAVSSSQLPSKGILKNKDPHSDIRKAKSMEVLSPRVAKGQHPGGAKNKGVGQAGIEHARAKFLEGKLQFSAFLDEITKQVISPSYLTVLGVNTDKASSKACAPAQTPGPVKPQLPPKKHRGSSGEEREKHLKEQSRQEKSARNSSAQKHSDSSKSEKIISYAARSHHGSPPPHHYPNSASHSIHHGRGRKDKRPSPLGSSGAVDKFGRCGPQLTDGTSTSPEPIQPKQRHHRKQQTTALHNPHPNTQHFHHSQSQQALHGLQRGPNPSPPSSLQGAGVGLRSESSSSKSDSSRTRDTASTATSHSSGQSGHHNSQHAGSARQHRETPCDVEHLQALQEENADLHQNLLQTVVCIESLEAELQRTRDELINVKEKYKSLLETHSGTKQANNLLGEHLHIASESLTSERKYLLNRVSQLSSELEDAHRTIGALENINVPCLIKDLLEKHFDSPEAVQKFLTTSAFAGRSAAPPQAGHQPHEGAEDWMMKSEAGLQRATAFSPFNQEAPRGRTEVSCQNETSPPFSVDDISNAIYEKIAANYAARSQSVFPHGHDRSARGTNCTDTPPNLQQALAGGDSLCEKGEVQVTLLEEDVVDVTSMSAQQILDDFMHQLQAHKEVGGGKEQQGRQEWAGGVEQTGKVAD